ncbi:excinuclease ABC subunit C [Halosegnis marinus]|uniref:UvrABC system protein C n=1 Tax=Halosegnis marinus TaxID=3034023 RepID=A0ABD5ZPD2_9EURY|nr:excinuclease ABC subunit C [Halosegnis sp. DT85]
MDTEAVRARANDLPTKPGVYQFERGDAVLYVGKAVDLRDRVRSYADPRGERIRRMVARAERIDFSVTETETQALLLEANLVKRFQPKYNVRLKDDKSYPLVQLTDHEFPRIEITRDPDDAATVFGPYTNKGRVETAVKALRETFGVRGCSDYKFAGRDRPCLDYEVGLCTAPCVGEIDAESYLGDVDSVRRFLDGETGVLADPMRAAMEAAAGEQEFERAANLRDRLAAVESFHEGGAAAVQGEAREARVEVLGVAVEGADATVARLVSEDGKLVDRERHRVTAPEASEVSRLLSAFLPQFYAERDLPDAVLLQERPSDPDVLDWLEREGTAVRVPGAGREATLVDLALKNARRQTGRRDECAALAAELGIDAADRIEGFDVSHAQGKAVVGSDVCFVDGDESKADYRRKKLADENDDYANMRRLVRWRAERAVAGRDDRPDPDLLLIDGGEGQLNAALEALEETGWDVPAVGLAKAEERVVAPDRAYDWPSDADHLRLLQRVRDEAHRFAVAYHQQVRDAVSTTLDDLPGVGPELRRRLLRRFGSVEGVRNASEAELADVEGVGPATAATIAARL